VAYFGGAYGFSCVVGEKSRRSRQEKTVKA
jgi:hypothetical protein